MRIAIGMAMGMGNMRAAADILIKPEGNKSSNARDIAELIAADPGGLRPEL